MIDLRMPQHGRHWELARYELPLKEVERKVNGRSVIDVTVGDTEVLAYVHRRIEERVEFTRPRLENKAAALEEADAKWQCELAIAEGNREARQPDCRVGFLDLSTVRTCTQIVREWHHKAATNPEWRGSRR